MASSRMLRGALLGALLFTLGCAGHRASPGASATLPATLYVLNKNPGIDVDVAVYVDDALVDWGTQPRWAQGATGRQIGLRLTPGVHRVRAVVAGESATLDLDVTPGEECRFSVLYYEEPQDAGPGAEPSRLVLEQIYPC